MLYTKEYLTGSNIDLSKYNLGVIRQIRVDEFMHNHRYDLVDFVRHFYLEQRLDLNKDIRENKIHFTYFCLLSEEDNKVLKELIKSLIFLYELSDEKDKDGNYRDIKLCIIDNRFILILKKKDKPIAFIDDSNFNILSRVMLEMCYFDKPEPEKEVKGDPKLIEKMNKARRRYEEKHGKKNGMLFEELVRQVMHIRKVTYDEVKDWTIWQIKDVYTVEYLMESSDRSYLLATNSNVSMDFSKIKDWKNETKLVRE